MELTLDEKNAKELFKEALMEVMEEKRDLFLDVVLEAIEEIGLEDAIREGRQNEFVSQDQISAILSGGLQGQAKSV